MAHHDRPHVVIIGAGFAGLWAARTLANRPVDVTVIDKNNYHTFLALLYQVAAAELEAEDIAYPIRSIFWELPNVNFILAHATLIDRINRIIKTDIHEIHYDYLLIATGSITHDYGVTGVSDYAFFLKTLEEGIVLKNHIICCFEAASIEMDMTRSQHLLTFVIIGGGATGVEYAGALSELIHGPLRKDFPSIDFKIVRIILLEASDRLVGHMPDEIRRYTIGRLREMGVDVRLSTPVIEVKPDRVITKAEEIISTRTIVWTAGVRGEPLAASSGIAVERDDRVSVLPTLQIAGHPEIYTLGDLASIRQNGRLLPQVAQVAIQSGVCAAKNILHQISGREPVPFVYNDRGSMITIGRNAAGVAIGSQNYTGFPAWILWLIIHLFNLIGFRNRMMVLINWAWDYLLYERAVRFVFPKDFSCGKDSTSCPLPNHSSEIKS
ncbi:MAG: NADH:ubiquinone reductase (H+-translocating) [Syntrophus sp. SKADARSKE-3]|nr:NADH:ubiquinone reductase (H+-translocating) [Syntrophus sp. SKADARSKE-3]